MESENVYVYNFVDYNQNGESDTEEEIEDHGGEPDLILYYTSLIHFPPVILHSPSNITFLLSLRT